MELSVMFLVSLLLVCSTNYLWLVLSILLFTFYCCNDCHNVKIHIWWQSCFFQLQHAYRDGRVEDVVLRHLGNEDGQTVIAKNIRLYPVPFQFHFSSFTWFTSLTSFWELQAVRFPWWFAYTMKGAISIF